MGVWGNVALDYVCEFVLAKARADLVTNRLPTLSLLGITGGIGGSLEPTVTLLRLDCFEIKGSDGIYKKPRLL